MDERITLTSRADGFFLGAYMAQPESQPAGGVLVIQEIFGVTTHIKEMCAVFAEAGYTAIAPSLFDRVEAGFLAEHDQAGIQKGIGAVASSPWPQVVGDMQAAIDALPRPAYVTGFCYGGTGAWMAAAQCSGFKAASCFYGRLIVNQLEHRPKVPVMLHYGARDASIPPQDIERVRLAAPEAPLYLYDAGHGFCRAGSRDFNAPASELALTRTLDWFARWR
jgi:carboxymethylenebutenolidase